MSYQHLLTLLGITLIALGLIERGWLFEDGLRILSAVRPGIRLSREQRRCIEIYAQNMG
jgi:hypothetical protein